MSDFKPLPGQFTGRHMAVILVAFFGVIIGVNLLMAVVATRSWTGVVVANSYVASQNFNAGLAAARKQAELGWQARLELDAGSALVSLIDGNIGDRPLQGLTVTLQLSRPTHEGEDRLVSLSETEPGRYEAELGLDDGVWNAELLAISTAGSHFRQTRRLIVKAGTAMPDTGNRNLGDER